MMNPDLLAHLCKLIGYLDGDKDTARFLDLAPYMQPIEDIVDKEIAAYNTPIVMGETPKMPADLLESCTHFGVPVPEKCECPNDCPCKQGGCSPIDPANLDEDGFLKSIFCEHANEAPMICPCPDNCYCKKNTCKPVAAKELPLGIIPNPDGTAYGTNSMNEQDEDWFHCPEGCDGWHKGIRVEKKVYDEKRLGVAYCCPVCQIELLFVGKDL